MTCMQNDFAVWHVYKRDVSLPAPPYFGDLVVGIEADVIVRPSIKQAQTKFCRSTGKLVAPCQLCRDSVFQAFDAA